MTSGQREMVAFVGAVLVVLLCVVFAVRMWRTPSSEVVMQTELPEVYSRVTIQEAQRVVMGKSTFTLPAITSVADVSQDSLPNSISALIPEEGVVVSIRSTRDASNRLGYLIVYDLGTPMNRGFSIVRSVFSSDWKALIALNSASFGLVERESSAYRAQAQVTLIEQDHLRVSLRIQSIR